MAKLAVLGGKPVSKTGYDVTWPAVTEAEVRAAVRVTRSGGWWRFSGNEVEEFEREFARYNDSKHCLGVVNGTAALEAALRACGIEAGDEVIVPSVTFVASASAVLLVQGIPVFADVLEATCQIDPADVERKITPRTKAILVVHYAGYPADMDAIPDIARRRGLRVVEDCAHAHGTEWRGRKVGEIGDVGAFSFQESKSLTCGEGGAVVTGSEELYNAAYAYHHIGRTLGSEKYGHTSVGPNYRMNEFQGAILRAQLKKLPSQTKIRMRNAGLLSDGLAEVPGLEPLREDGRVTQRGYYFYVLRFDEGAFGMTRERFMEAMKAEGAPLGAGYGSPVYHLPVFRDMHFGAKGCPLTCGHYGGEMEYGKVSCPAAEEVSYGRHLTIPNHVLLKAKNVRLIVKAARKVYENRRSLIGPSR